MNISIKGTNLELTDSIYTYVDKKMKSLARLFEGAGATGAWVEVGRTSNRHKSGDVFRAEIQVKLPGAEGMRSESTQMDLHLAIDEARNDIERQFKKYRGMQGEQEKRGAREAKERTRYSEAS